MVAAAPADSLVASGLADPGHAFDQDKAWPPGAGALAVQEGQVGVPADPTLHAHSLDGPVRAWRHVSFPVYIMSGDMPGDDLPFSGISVTTASVVSTMAAIEAAFWSAERVTLAGSTIPASNMSTNLSFRAS